MGSRKNIRARKFYEKYGFLIDGEKKEIELGEKLYQVKYFKNIK